MVPVLYEGIFDTVIIDKVLKELDEKGSVAFPGFMRPEGIVIYHKAANCYFKKTLLNDSSKYETN